jgi:hypothetical protein
MISSVDVSRTAPNPVQYKTGGMFNARHIAMVLQGYLRLSTKFFPALNMPLWLSE